MAQGELLGKSKGKIVGVRVLPPEGQNLKLEMTMQGDATLLSQRGNVVGTFWQTTRQDGKLYAEGRALFMTPVGPAVWTGFGIGSPARSTSFAATYAVCGYFQTEAKELELLNKVCCITEFTVNADEAPGQYYYEFVGWAWGNPILPPVE